MGRPPKPLDVASIAQLHEAGVTLTRLARMHGVRGDRIVRALEEAGVAVRRGAFGRHHPAWKGGRADNGAGYVRITLSPDDPLRRFTDKGQMLEHRYVVARAIGRPLEPYETVHHIDGDRTNNDLSNLQLRVGAHGQGVVLVCRTCGSHDVDAVRLDDGASN